MNYVTHTCRNSKLKPNDPNYCDRAWVDEDLTNVTTTPPTWKYCEECVKKGFPTGGVDEKTGLPILIYPFKNPKRRKSTMTPEQIEAFKQRMAEYRRKKNGQ